MRRGRGFNLENVVRHLSRRDTSLGWMFSSHGVPFKASANRRGKNLAITITQGYKKQRVRRSHNEAIVIDVGGLGNEDRPTCSKLKRDEDHLQVYVDKT